MSDQDFVPNGSVVIIGSDKKADDDRKNNPNDDKERKQHTVQGDFIIIFCHDFVSGKQHQSIPCENESQTEAKGQGASYADKIGSQ